MPAKLKKFLRLQALGFIKNQDGATMVEYAMMVALIAITCVLIIQAVGTGVASVFDQAQAVLSSTGPGTPTAPGSSGGGS